MLKIQLECVIIYINETYILCLDLEKKDIM